MKFFVLFLASLLMFAPLITIGIRKLTGMKAKRALLTNIGSFCVLFAMAVIMGFTSSASAAEVSPADAAQAANGLAEGLKYSAAALAVGLSGIGGGLAVASSASAALGAISENEKAFGKSMIFVGMAEGVALYGLIIALVLLFVS